MRKLEVLNDKAESCTSAGFLRKLSCEGTLEMLKDAQAENIEDNKEILERIGSHADAAYVIAAVGLNIARETGRVDLIHQADQIGAMAEEAKLIATSECLVACPGGRAFSVVCRAGIYFSYSDGRIEPL